MKHIHLVVVFILSFQVLHSQLNNGLILHYDFSNGQATDLSGNNLHGNVNATPTAGMNGNPNTAMLFNGINNYIDLPNNPILKPQLPVTIGFGIES